MRTTGKGPAALQNRVKRISLLVENDRKSTRSNPLPFRIHGSRMRLTAGAIQSNDCLHGLRELIHDDSEAISAERPEGFRGRRPAFELHPGRRGTGDRKSVV